MRHKVPVVLTTEFFNEGYPKLGVMLKLLEFERINDITKITRDHASSFVP
jgi:hypothetical protein